MVRRHGIVAVYGRETVFARTLRRLGQQRHVAEPDAGHGDAVAGRIEPARGRAVFGGQFGVLFGTQRFVKPAVVFGRRNQFRIARTQVTPDIAFGIAVEDGAAFHDCLFELFFRGRKAAQVVPFALQFFQEMVERGQYFQTGGHQRITARPFEVIDRDFFILIGFGPEFQVIRDGAGELFGPARNGFEQVQPFVVDELGVDSHRHDAAVQFGHHDALTQEAAYHTLFVGHPVVVGVVDRDRADDGNVSFLEPFDAAFALSHQHTAVGHVDDGVGADLLQQFQPFGETRNRIDVHSAGLEVADQRVEVLLVGVERPGHSHQKGHFRPLFLVESVFPVISVELPDRSESLFVIQVEQHVAADLDRRFDRPGEEVFAVQVAPDPVEQAAVVFRTAVAEVSLYGFPLRGIEARDVIGRIGDRGGVDRNSLGFELFEHGPVVVGHPDAHAENQYGIVILQFSKLFQLDRFELHGVVIQRFGHTGHLVSREIDHCNPGRAGRRVT